MTFPLPNPLPRKDILMLYQFLTRAREFKRGIHAKEIRQLLLSLSREKHPHTISTPYAGEGILIRWATKNLIMLFQFLGRRAGCWFMQFRHSPLTDKIKRKILDWAGWISVVPHIKIPRIFIARHCRIK